MKSTTFHNVLDKLGSTLLSFDREGTPDRDLLDRFLTQQDQVAFRVLVQRHGPMVLGVCKRVLRNEADAEDAFQATFLVLVRKASTIRKAYSLGSWLYGVAYTTSLKARAMSIKRAIKEKEAAQNPSSSIDPGMGEELQKLLDQELNRLPDIYRSVIVLCDLQGKSNKDAAQLLDCPLGTVCARLSRGRKLLATRLQNRGVVLSSSALVTWMTQQITVSALSPTLLNSTLHAATTIAANHSATSMLNAKVAALTEGVLKTMLIKKLRLVTTSTVALIAISFGLVGELLPTSVSVAQTPEIVKNVEQALTPKRLQGVWIPDQIVTTKGVTKYPLVGRALSFQGNQFVKIEGNHAVASGSFQVEDGFLRLTTKERNPWDLEASETKEKLQYAFQVEGDLLTLCYSVGNKGKSGDMTPGKDRQVVVYKRQSTKTKSPNDPNSSTKLFDPLGGTPSPGDFSFHQSLDIDIPVQSNDTKYFPLIGPATLQKSPTGDPILVPSKNGLDPSPMGSSLSDPKAKKDPMQNSLHPLLGPPIENKPSSNLTPNSRSMRNPTSSGNDKESTLKNHLIDLKIEEKELLQTLGEDHPQVKTTRRRIQTIQEHLENSHVPQNNPTRVPTENTNSESDAQRIRQLEKELADLRAKIQKKTKLELVSKTFPSDHLPIEANSLRQLLLQMAHDRYPDGRLSIQVGQTKNLVLQGDKESIDWASIVIGSLNNLKKKPQPGEKLEQPW